MAKLPTVLPPDARAVRHRRSWQLVTSTVRKAWQDRILGLSAESAFWQLLSLPSLVLALLGAIGYFAPALGPGTLQQIEEQIITSAGQVATGDVVESVIRPVLDQVLGGGRADVISIGFAISLWAGSSAMATFVNTITIAYGMRDLRGAVHSRLIALWIYFVSLAITVIVLPLLVIGPTALLRIIPDRWRGLAGDTIRIAYWPVLAGLLLLGLAALYHYATPVRLRWRRAVPGAAVAVGLFVLGTYLLREYFLIVVDKSQTYGALAAPIAALLFFYILALAVLLGAELNATMERLWPKGPKRRRIDRLRARIGDDEPDDEPADEPADEEERA